jgi:hypothetical protein
MEETVQRICKQTLVEIYNSKFCLVAKDDRMTGSFLKDSVCTTEDILLLDILLPKFQVLRFSKNEENRNGEGNSTLKNLCNAFLFLQRYEFKMNHEE